MLRLSLILSLILVTISRAENPTKPVRESIDKSLSLLRHSAQVYIEERNCFSCHHQALPAMTMRLARERGFEVDRKKARAQSQFTVHYYEPRREQLLEGSGVPGGPFSAGYALVGLHADEWKADETTDGLVRYLLKKQQKDGHWRIGTNRPPIEASDFTSTALSLRGLQLYASEEQAEEVRERLERAQRWLLKTEAKDQEDRTFQLLGLRWLEVEESQLKPFVETILEKQREDGGWGQLDDMESDAYATGQALVALHLAGGLKTEHPAYQKGLRYLLKGQSEDGSWLVKSRSRPFQTYFESGYPHKKNQWISIAAASWATMALLYDQPVVRNPRTVK